jgi:hypothetical protein
MKFGMETNHDHIHKLCFNVAYVLLNTNMAMVRNFEVMSDKCNADRLYI